MAECSEYELYQKADNLVRNAGQHFQFLFLQRWELLTEAKWNGKDSSQVLVDKLGTNFSKMFQTFQKKQVRQGIVEEWDITLLSRLLLHFNKNQKEETNQAIQSITKDRNKLAHNASKKLNFEEYSSIEDSVKNNLIILGMEEKAVQKIIDLAEATSMNSAIELLKKLQKEGDELFKKEDYEEAIKVYSDAIILPNLPSVYLSALYEKRAFCYFSLSNKTKKEEELDLSFGDGEKAIELNSSSWKGHHILALIHQKRSKLDDAQVHFRRSLAISPSQMEVKADYDACKILAGKISREEHMDPRQMPMTLSERVKHFNDEMNTNISEEFFLKAAEFGGELIPGYEHVARGHQNAGGWGVPQNYSEAARHYAKAAKVGNADGIYNLALLYKDGKGVKQDIPYAVELLFEAASKPVEIKGFGFGKKDVGVLAAQHVLGLCHHEGVGVPKDNLKASYWYKKAADNGSGHAANNLALMYSTGEGVPLNEKMAEMYWKISVADKNYNAAQSLYGYYMKQMEPQLAKSYFNTAIELGNDRLKTIKPQVYEMIEKMEKERGKLEGKIKAFERKNGLSTRGLIFFERISRQASMQSSVMAKFLEDNKKLKDEDNWAGKRRNIDMENLVWKAEEGSKTAQSILKCLENNFYFISIWELRPPQNVAEIENLIDKLYVCMTTEHHMFTISREMHAEVLAFLNDLFQSVGKEKCKLDMQLRLCLTFLHFVIGGAEEFHAELLVEGVRRYPDEIPLHRALSDAYGNLKESRKGLQVTIAGLLKAPNDPDLLYNKAVHLRLMDERGLNEIKIRQAYKEFIENAPVDHRKLPEAYYSMAATYVLEMNAGENQEASEMLCYYYGLGEDAEKMQLNCYLPYESPIKIMLKSLVMLIKDKGNTTDSKSDYSGMNGSTRAIAGKSDETKLYLTDPQRIGIIKMHREAAEYIRKEPFKNTSSQTPKLVHKIPKSITDLQAIVLKEMNPTKDMIYEGRILNLTLIEDPNLGWASIHLVAEDDNGDATRLYIYNVKQNAKARKIYGFGAKLSVINPYMRIAQDLTNGIRVDDPKCIIHMEGVVDMCRYCGMEGAKSNCSRCKKAKYCGRECQERDWKVLKHKLICLNGESK